MEYFGDMLIGAGIGLCLAAIVIKIRSYKFNKFVGQVHVQGKQLVRDALRETSELSFRDKTGKLCKVKIVVDHALDDAISQKEVINKSIPVFAGTMDDLMTGAHKITKGASGQTEEFVFSPKAVQHMRASGVEPDDVVRQMLKAAGRIT